MNKKEFFIGVFIGIITALIGTILFIILFTDFDLAISYKILKSNGYLGKTIALGTVLDLILFGILLKQNKETIAKGIIGSVILLALLTLFI